MKIIGRRKKGENRMKRVIMLLGIIVVVVTVLVSGQAFAQPAWNVSIDDSMGVAFYKENDTIAGSTVKSDWKAFYNKTTIALSNYDGEGIEGEVRYGMFLTPNAKETWDVNSVRYQTNDMGFWGIDTGIDIGWGFSFEGVSDFADENLDITLTPLVGYRWKFFRFSRTNFNVSNIITSAETVDEDYSIHCLDLGARIGLDLGEKWEVFAKPIFGIVLYNSAKNSALGTIKGDGGFIFNMDTGVNYRLSENFVLGLMFTTEIQRLQGGTKDSIMWPDNSLDMYGGKISLTYEF